MLASTKNYETKKPFDDRAIAGQAITFLLAGYDTTANALTFTMYLLARHPEYQERAAKECAGASIDKLTSLEDLE